MLFGQPTLYLNENIPVPVIGLLATRGVPAIHTRDVGNLGKSDEAQLIYASSRGYIVVTHDRRDFLRLHERWIMTGKSHRGILLVRPSEPDILVKRVVAFFKTVYPTAPTSFCLSPPELSE